MKQSGNRSKLYFERIEDVSILSDFNCGLDVMDRFIHSGLQWCIDYHYCVVYAIKEEDSVVAVVALGCDKLELNTSDKEELQMGFSTVVPEAVELVFDGDCTYGGKALSANVLNTLIGGWAPGFTSAKDAWFVVTYDGETYEWKRTTGGYVLQ